MEEARGGRLAFPGKRGGDATKVRLCGEGGHPRDDLSDPVLSRDSGLCDPPVTRSECVLQSGRDPLVCKKVSQRDSVYLPRLYEPRLEDAHGLEVVPVQLPQKEGEEGPRPVHPLVDVAVPVVSRLLSRVDEEESPHHVTYVVKLPPVAVLVVDETHVREELVGEDVLRVFPPPLLRALPRRRHSYQIEHLLCSLPSVNVGVEDALQDDHRLSFQTVHVGESLFVVRHAQHLEDAGEGERPLQEGELHLNVGKTSPRRPRRGEEEGGRAPHLQLVAGSYLACVLELRVVLRWEHECVVRPQLLLGEKALLISVNNEISPLIEHALVPPLRRVGKVARGRLNHDRYPAEDDLSVHPPPNELPFLAHLVVNNVHCYN